MGGNCIGETETFAGFCNTKGLEGGIRAGGLERGGGPVGVARVGTSHCLNESGGGGGKGGGGGTPSGCFVALLVLVLTGDSTL